MTTLNDWKSVFFALDDCPWAGPRPLGTGPLDHPRLIGREGDARQFAENVIHHHLVVLTGESGVGKSSLLNARLVHILEEKGFHPFLCNTWTRPSEDVLDADSFLRSKIASRLDEPLGENAGPLYEELEARYSDLAVVVFDQFEELIRYQPALFKGIVDWIVEANHQSRIRIVLSLRSEFRHKLRPLEVDVRPFSMSTVVLEPLTDEATIKEIIAGHDKARSPMTPAAVDRIWEHWRAAIAAGAVTWTDISLLHLQATLYALHDLAAGSVVDTEHVSSLLSRGGPGSTIFGIGLREAVRLKLDRCLKACSDPRLPRPLDRILVEGTKAAAHRLIPHLSSGGYKLEREEWELARTTLARQLGHLLRGRDAQDTRYTLAEVERVFRYLTSCGRAGCRPERPSATDPACGDLLSTSRLEIANASGVALNEPATSPKLRANGVDVAPWDEDCYDVSSGPLLGFSPASVAIEELRRVVFAMCWLETSMLVRASSPSYGQTMLLLIHDRFGSALESWAEGAQLGPEEATAQLSAVRGEIYHWLNPDDPDLPHSAFDGSTDEVTLTNLRWRDCQVSAAFRRVLFVNCDFRGTRFRDCRFHGVIFINCLLDGASFEECKLRGVTGERTRGDLPSGDDGHLLKVDSKLLPDFRIVVKPEIVSILRRYRCSPEADESHGDEMLYSRTSGVAALPWSRNYGRTLAWRSETGGLTMYGGRLSSLMIRQCTFEEHGVLALRHVAGSGLDIVEQEGGGRIEITESAIRGLTVTRAVHGSATGHGRSPGARLDIDVDDCLVSNVWFGAGLTGRARFAHCKLWHVCNVSACEDFGIAIEESFYHGLVNVGRPDSTSSAMAGYQESEIKGREAFAREVRGMDYRRVPGKFELVDSER